MRCKCGHDIEDHPVMGDRIQMIVGCRASIGLNEDETDIVCSCTQFDRDTNWEPPDPPGWEGGFADNH